LPAPEIKYKPASAPCSMGLTGQENAYAERINGTIKNEYLAYREIRDEATLRREVARAVQHYNSCRLHNHLDRQTPLGFLSAYAELAEEACPVVEVPVLSRSSSVVPSSESALFLQT